jgi:hypothetical protein
MYFNITIQTFKQKLIIKIKTKNKLMTLYFQSSQIKKNEEIIKIFQ